MLDIHCRLFTQKCSLTTQGQSVDCY